MLIYFRLDPAAAAEAENLDTASPGIRLLAEYLSEEGHPFPEANLQSKCLKVVGVLMNLESLKLPSALSPIVQKFNGKPVLVERETRKHDSCLSREIVELAVDIRGFNPVARLCLCRLREHLLHADIQIGLTIQGCSDEELPEQLLGVARFSGFDVVGGVRAEPSVAESIGNVHGEPQSCSKEKLSASGHLSKQVPGYFMLLVGLLFSMLAIFSASPGVN
jgi:hypothetical protein